MKKRSKKIVMYGLTPAFAGLLMVGMASADTIGVSSPTNNQSGFNMGSIQRGHKNDAALAKALGITEIELQASLKSGLSVDQLIKVKGLSKEKVMSALKAERDAQMKAKIAADVASGKITQAQADAKAAKHTARELKHKTALANALGISTQTLDAEIAAGKTMSELAASYGLTEASLKAKLEAAREAEIKADLSTRVATGKITQAQADKILNHKLSKNGEHRGHKMNKRGNIENTKTNAS